MAAHLTVQAAHAIDCPAAVYSQVSHVEWLRCVVRVLASQCQQIVEGNAERLCGMLAQVLPDEGRRKAVKSGCHGRVSCKKIARPGDGQRDLKGTPRLCHVTSGAFQDGKGRMPFIQVTDLRLDAQRTEQSPAADPKEQFL